MERTIKMSENDMNKRKSKVYIVILIVILLLTLLFVILNSALGRIDVLMPTGNIDIFDIIINCDKCEECEECPTCETCPACKNNDTKVVVKPVEPIDDQNEKPIEPEKEWYEEEDPSDIGFVVKDKVDKYENQAALRIFENTAYELTGNKIAPGVTNSYQFVIRNNNDFNIKYSVSMIENNPDSINMKYRLKQNGNYVIGDDNNWVDASELHLEEIILTYKSLLPYMLEWKWFDSDNDTYIGKNATDIYQLSIDINAEEIA